MIGIVLAACLSLLPTVAHPQQPQSPDAPNRKSTDGFSAQLYVISNYDKFIKEWTTTSAEHVPRITTVSKAKRGDALAITVFFTGCRVNTSQHCNATYDLTVIKPDGSTLLNFPALELWQKVAPPDSPNTQLAAAIPQIKFEKTHPAGTYRIAAVVRDENRQVTLRLETILEIK
jgi:hypothetical protein